MEIRDAWPEGRSRIIEVLIDDHNGMRVVATVRKERNLRTAEWEPATVNWPALGAKPAQAARAMGRALQEAADVAERLDASPEAKI